MRAYVHNACVCARVCDVLNHVYSYICVCGVSVCVRVYTCVRIRMYCHTYVRCNVSAVCDRDLISDNTFIKCIML